MIKILVDHNLEGQALTLWDALVAEGWLELFSAELVRFADIGLPIDSNDREVWRFAQANRMILLTNNGSFEYIPIPDDFGIDERTYTNTTGLKGRKLVEYFPKFRQAWMGSQSIHFDPEFATFTYGDPTSPKAGLRRLEKGDLLIFYCGLEGWGFKAEPALYLMGYFEILTAGKAGEFNVKEIQTLFGKNFHVRHQRIYEQQKADLVLIKGSEQSRLLKKVVRISTMGQDRTGKPLKVLSPEMQKIFGNFNGGISFQRSPTRWVDPAYVTQAFEFMKSLDL